MHMHIKLLSNNLSTNDWENPYSINYQAIIFDLVLGFHGLWRLITCMKHWSVYVKIEYLRELSECIKRHPMHIHIKLLSNNLSANDWENPYLTNYPRIMFNLVLGFHGLNKSYCIIEIDHMYEMYM